MKHSGGALSLKRADADTRFVVAGMGAQLALYDLRALRETDAGSGQGQARYGGGKYTAYRETQGMPVAQPVLKFEEYDNQYDMLGMDVCAELGIVAAAETGGYLRMSSLRTGRTVKKWRLSQSGDEKIGCVRFVEDGVCGAVKLMASCGPRIVELVW
jgi:hypothetical protein